MSAEAQKRAAGEAGAALVEPGMTVGLGTGSTSAFFIAALGARLRGGLAIRGGVATSLAAAALAREAGVPLLELDEAGRIDLTVDGADEIGPGLAVIKGGGAALLGEKLVWEASARCVAIVDAAKLKPVLGGFPLPVEVVRFGHATTVERLRRAAAHAGAPAEPRLRMAGAEPLVTDGGHLIYDLPCDAIPDPVRLARALKALTGVVEHGLFPGLADMALVGTDDGVRSLTPEDGFQRTGL